MKKLNHTALIFVGLLLTVAFSTVRAQNETPAVDAPKQNFNQARRPSLLAELDLSTDQIQQIRRLNRDRQPLRRAAQQRLKAASQNLDQAIYADSVDENEIQTRLKDVQLAQAEVSKIKALNEYEVRKILTPAQLVKFREVRARFMQQLETLQERRRNRPLNAPNQRLFNRQRNLRQNN